MKSNKTSSFHPILANYIVLILIFAAAISCTSEGESNPTDTSTENASNTISNATPSNTNDAASHATTDATSDVTSNDVSSSNAKALSSTDQLFEKYYETPSTVRPRTASGHSLEVWKEAIQAFSDKDYNVALAKYSELANTDGFVQKAEVQFFSGICQMELGDYNGAINTFAEISTKSSYSLDTKWYMCLAYVKVGRFEKAKPLLDDMQNAAGYKAAEAEFIFNAI